MTETTTPSITDENAPMTGADERRPVSTQLLACALYLAAAAAGFMLVGYLLDLSNATGVCAALAAYRSAIPWLPILGSVGPVALLLLRVRLGRGHGPLEGACDGAVLHGLWFLPALLGNNVVLYGTSATAVAVGAVFAWRLCVREHETAGSVLDAVVYRGVATASAITICVTALMGAQALPIAGLSPAPLPEQAGTEVEHAWSSAYQMVDRAESRACTPQRMVLAMQGLVHAEAVHLGMADCEPRVMLCAGDELVAAQYRPEANEIWVSANTAFLGDVYGSHMVNALCVEVANTLRYKVEAGMAVDTDEDWLVEAAKRSAGEPYDEDYMVSARAYGQRRTKAYLSQWLPEGEAERLTPSVDAKLPVIL